MRGYAHNARAVALPMKAIIDAVDEIQMAEQRHYVALQQYSRAVRLVTAPEVLEKLRSDLCDSFAELQAAHDALALHCKQ